MVVPKPVASTMVAPLALDSFTLKLSSPSAAVSTVMGTSTLRLVVPAAKSSFPDLAVKSAPMAVPCGEGHRNGCCRCLGEAHREHGAAVAGVASWTATSPMATRRPGITT